MSQGQTRFSWAAFWGSFSICLAIGLASSDVVSHGVSREFGDYAVLAASLSFLVAMVFGYHRLILKGFGWACGSIARLTAKEYVKNRLSAYRSPIRILSLGENDGTVNLILGAGTNGGVVPDALFDVVTEHGGNIFGQVKVTTVEMQKCWTVPVNRVNVEFWERLEDRMKVDVSPPPNMVARRQLPEGVEQFLEELK